MSLSSLNSIGQTVFKLESGNENVDKQTGGQTDKIWTNKRTEFHQFRKEPSYDSDLSPGNEKCGRTDGRQTHQSHRQVGYTTCEKSCPVNLTSDILWILCTSYN